MKDLNSSTLKRKPRLILDMDDVIVDYVGVLIADLNRDYGTSHTVEDCKTWYLETTFGSKINDYVYFKGRFDDLPVKNNSVSYIKEIIESNRYDVFIVTACPPQAFEEKYNWVKKYMPFFNLNRIIPCSEKSAIWGDVIVDDKGSNVDEFVENSVIKSIGFIYDMPHNRDKINYDRLFDLSDLLNKLDNIFYPKM